MDGDTQTILARLRRIEGQIRGIQKMVEQGRGCEQVVTQIISARTALDGAAAHLVTSYVNECMTGEPPEEARRDITRAVQLLSRVG